jgi:hypothetical protein
MTRDTIHAEDLARLQPLAGEVTLSDGGRNAAGGIAIQADPAAAGGVPHDDGRYRWSYRLPACDAAEDWALVAVFDSLAAGRPWRQAIAA